MDAVGIHRTITPSRTSASIVTSDDVPNRKSDDRCSFVSFELIVAVVSITVDIIKTDFHLTCAYVSACMNNESVTVVS